MRLRGSILNLDGSAVQAYAMASNGVFHWIALRCLAKVGSDEREDVRLEAVEIRVVEDFERRVLDGAVHPLCLAVVQGW